MPVDWSDEQNDAIVADYFAMLGHDVTGQSYSKAGHNRLLQAAIGRPRGSIEYKHQNVSAVLKGLGETWIPGYKPAFNFQASLVDAVVRWLDRHPEWLASAARRAPSAFQEEPMLWIGSPPTHSNAPPPDETEQMAAIARKYDVAQRDAQNQALGRAGEERILAHERTSLLAAGRTDLANHIRWVSHVDGDGAGYDIRSFDVDGRDRLIEVKTTNGWERTPFHITRNELTASDRHRNDWLLMRLWNFAREPRAFELRPPIEAHVSLMASVYRASFLP
ncbi:MULTISPECIES: DUF3883 domain-containing protein [unclassified Mesorhizobium]|uniref:DUF3883 domain-containing protein n=1 Tax=unclassified Mesorhizobium TaxID=325217 RepID=UPI00112B9ABE|nr:MULTISPECIES: DUF3883 domain-containing protein [unclassified Mesorhizobium]TPK66280.1 DUF3883 domain-containing protein [Mesorhizobium sp. B2-5-1]TPM60658.1 DUF3883 domain-containing protein [Mesorhizobium sp. B2-1-9]TPM88011.1 DUF3883 domain-containing protein [Mesorhizobium sp. B2-1-4]TPN11069.1 DUF3883 domain-containing protein [Mesorhizobium sp. B2-1-2]UCI14724.1 DUF3883 domain-containing protein [Mesorhizobium sp. B2-1-1]